MRLGLGAGREPGIGKGEASVYVTRMMILVGVISI